MITDPTHESDAVQQELTPVPLMQLATGFWAFKTFAVAVELDLFTRLEGREVTVDELATELGFEHRPADLLLIACASLGLLEKAGDRYQNSPMANEFLVVGRPYYFGGFVRFVDVRQYVVWHELVKALQTNRPLTWDPDVQDTLFSNADPVMMSYFWEAMHAASTFTGRVLAEAHDFSTSSRVLDVGGGSGAFAIELCRRYSHLSGDVFDLPHVCDIAASKIADNDLTERIGTVAGDFMDESPLPSGYDAILLSSILHDWDIDTDRMLLSKCHAALEPGGTLLVCEIMVNPERSGPASAALMGMNMLVETEGGKNYSETEYVTWLEETGFTDICTLRFEAAGANGAIVAVKS